MTDPIDPTVPDDACDPAPIKQRKGFAVMDRQKVRDIASLGGVAAHQSGRAHQWTSAEAKAAGTKSVQARIERDKRRFIPPPPENES